MVIISVHLKTIYVIGTKKHDWMTSIGNGLMDLPVTLMVDHHVIIPQELTKVCHFRDINCESKI